jgi:hypothetical protein
MVTLLRGANWPFHDFVSHTRAFIVLVGGASVSVVREHESNARVAVLLEALVLIFGSAAILHRWPSSLGGSFQ